MKNKAVLKCTHHNTLLTRFDLRGSVFLLVAGLGLVFGSVLGGGHSPPLGTANLTGHLCVSLKERGFTFNQCNKVTTTISAHE